MSTVLYCQSGTMLQLHVEENVLSRSILVMDFLRCSLLSGKERFTSKSGFTGRVCPRYTRRHSPVSTFHWRAVLSNDVEYISFPCSSTQFTPLAWPENTSRLLPAKGDHFRKVLSAEPVITHSLPAATQPTYCVWPRNSACSCKLLQFHTLHVLSSEAVARNVPSGERAIAFTLPSWPLSVVECLDREVLQLRSNKLTAEPMMFVRYICASRMILA